MEWFIYIALYVHIGILVSPIYYRLFMYIDAFPYVLGSKKLRKSSASDHKKANGILVLAGYLGVLTDVLNIDSHNLQFLQPLIPQFNDTMYVSKSIELWTILRS